MSTEEYDKLSQPERDARDKADRLREQAEQAGQPIYLYLARRISQDISPSSTL